MSALPAAAPPVPYYADELVTVYHGDSLTPALAALWTAGDVLVTDPPYGIDLESGFGGAFGDMRIAGDETPEARDHALGLWGPGRPAIVFGSWKVPRPAHTRAVLIWDKGDHTGMGDLTFPWKPCAEEVYVVGSGFAGRRTSCVLRYLGIAGAMTAHGKRNHPTEKPVGLMRDLVGKCPPGVIVDPFAGSGSTLRAAKDLGRRAIGIEADARYLPVIRRRMAQEALPFAAAETVHAAPMFPDGPPDDR